MRPPRRRAWLLEPDEPLLLSRGPVHALARVSAQMAEWGLGQDELFWSPLIGVALPRRPVLSTLAPPHCYGPRLKPEALWNPLLWLPVEVATPADGEELEDWTARVGIELVAAGIYDQATGTWLDVSSLLEAGELTADRARAWLEGGPDPELDHLTLPWADAHLGP